jgi:putative glutamine amidotransferase
MTQKQTVIGIVPSLDEGKLIPGGEIDRVYLRRDYLQAIASTGALPIILHPDMPTESIMSLCDGLVISGGADIDPAYYEQDNHETVTWLEPRERFDWEKELIEACDDYGMPILGVCYGMQRLNVHYGGDLIQDISALVPASHPHRNVMHEVTFQELFMGLSADTPYMINSRHHQAIGELAPGFIIRAKTDDGVVEAIEGNGHFGVQWHPESDDTATHIYSHFVAYCTPEEETVLEQQLAPQALQ